MQNTRPISRQTRIAWTFLAVVVLLGISAALLFVLNRETIVPASWGVDTGARDSLVDWFNVLASALVLPPLAAGLGVLILSRQPDNRIGHLLRIIGFVAVLIPLLSETTVYAHFTVSPPLPIAQYTGWVLSWIWIPLFTLVLWMLAIFPSGYILSRPWQWLIGTLLGLFAVPLLIAATTETPMSSAYQLANPFVTQSRETLSNTLSAIGNAAMPVAMLATLAAVIARFRQGSSIEKQQIKWLLFTLISMAAIVIGGLFLTFSRGLSIGAVMVNLSATLPLIGIGVAALRYRLYDIDLIINRALVYASLTLLLALVYFGTVIVLQTLFTTWIGEESPLIIVLSTLLIAALFTPLRQRVQGLIDRRFYRRRYNAEQVLANFARTTRDETDLHALVAELVHVVDDAMQPAGVQIMLLRTDFEQLFEERTV